jgi:hypothetical protein
MVIDRIENGIAVVEDGGRMTEIPLAELPKGAKEGSVLKKTKDGYELDLQTEAEMRKKLAERTRRLFK